MIPALPPWAPILAAAAVHHLDINPRRTTSRRTDKPDAEPTIVTWRDATLCAVLLLVPTTPRPRRSVAPLLRPLSRLLSASWPRLISDSTRRRLPDWLVGRSGPFGRGCLKVCEALCAYSLLSLTAVDDASGDLAAVPESGWRWSPSTPPAAIRLGPMPSPVEWLIFLCLSGAVNVVLWAWSRGYHSRGNHGGVNTMVRGTLGRSLEWRERARLAALALGNAACEEVVSRGFLLHEFMRSGGLTPARANAAQALAFGLWHYRGIPSGWVGVGLTSVYGGIMGALVIRDGGLALPVLAHAVADYFIFATIARRQIS